MSGWQSHLIVLIFSGDLFAMDSYLRMSYTKGILNLRKTEYIHIIITPKVYYTKNKIKRRSYFMERFHDFWPVLYWPIQRDLD